LKKRTLITLFLALVLAFIADLCLGTVYIKPQVIWRIINGSSTNEVASYIILQLRLPRAVMALLTGSGLAVAGLLMQTLFRNALAGPFVLGISSGAGLGVALAVMGSTALGIANLSGIGLVIPSILGSFLVLILIALLSLRIKDTMGLLIVGIMVGSLSSAIVGILSYLSTSDELKRYIFWSLGSLGNVSWDAIGLLTAIFCIALSLILLIMKPLNTLLLGESYARSLGINITKTRWTLILITSLLAGSITAFAGPIAFIGLAVPHIARLFMPTINHKVLIPVAMLLGAILLLCCDMIAQLPFSNLSLPINAVTSLLGAPLVIWLILKKRNLNF
jgi:iron complex transport system permease protein